jgi:hypothetical protein
MFQFKTKQLNIKNKPMGEKKTEISSSQSVKRKAPEEETDLTANQIRKRFVWFRQVFERFDTDYVCDDRHTLLQLRNIPCFRLPNDIVGKATIQRKCFHDGCVKQGSRWCVECTVVNFGKLAVVCADCIRTKHEQESVDVVELSDDEGDKGAEL